MFTNYKKKYVQSLVEIEALKEELEKAQSLQSLLSKLTDKTSNMITLSDVTSAGYLSYEDMHKSMFATDMVTGRKIIPENGIKCIKIAKDGDVEVGLTEEAPDKGYEYRLIR